VAYCNQSLYTYIPLTIHPQRGSRNISDIPPRQFYQNDSAMRNTADVTGGKPNAVWSQSISDVSAVNSLVTYYDFHGRKGEKLLFCSIPDATQDILTDFIIK
jgi:hypothetical protein